MRTMPATLARSAAATRRGWASLAQGAARRAALALARAPLMRDLRLRAEEADWRAGRRPDGFFGYYADVAEAVAAAPSQALGYDDAAMVDLPAMLAEDGGEPAMRASEYPVLFWLRAAIAGGARAVLDVGGNLGQAWGHARRYLDPPRDMRWSVLDVPAVARAGAERARRRGETALSFRADLDGFEGCDVVLAAGALQYLPPDFLPQALARMSRRPSTLLLHRTALSPSRGFVTLQAIVTRRGAVRFCPYAVAPRDGLLAALGRLGYREIDAWVTPRVFDLPGHPECADVAYHGLCLRTGDP